MIETAMVLAAGRGERMRPLSDVIPKPALPLPGGPVVAWPLALARAAGVSRMVVNTWHLAERMERALRDCDPRGELVVSREGQLMGTSGGLALARDRGLLAGSGPLLVANGDCVLELDLGPLIERHRGGQDIITLALLPHPDPSRWSQVLMTPAGQIERFASAGSAPGASTSHLYCGVMLVARSALGSLASGRGGIAEMLWQPALKAGRLGGAVVGGRWHEVGSPASYLEAVQTGLAGATRVSRDATVAASAEILSSLIAGGAEVAHGARVAHAVVAEGATVGHGATVERSVLMGRVAIAAGEVVRDQFRAC